MTSPYLRPTASIDDDAANKKRIIHCICAALSSFVLLPVVLLVITYLITKSLDIVNINVRFWLLDIACAVVAGLVIYPFRSLAWYWAALAGLVTGFASMILLAVVIDTFMSG